MKFWSYITEPHDAAVSPLRNQACQNSNTAGSIILLCCCIAAVVVSGVRLPQTDWIKQTGALRWCESERESTAGNVAWRLQRSLSSPDLNAALCVCLCVCVSVSHLMGRPPWTMSAIHHKAAHLFGHYGWRWCAVNILHQGQYWPPLRPKSTSDSFEVATRWRGRCIMQLLDE